MNIEKQKELLIDRFNKKWAGKELYFCPSIYSELNLAYSRIRACCMCTMVPFTPPIFYMADDNNYDSLDLNQYFRQINRIMTWNQIKEKSVCSGCDFYKKMVVPPIEKEGNIKLLSINNFTICNSNCVYCNCIDKKLDNAYELLPIINRFLEYKLINKETMVNWGGGEPVICSEFDKCASFLIEKGIRQNINSSGIKFSDFILEGMKRNLITIQISPDAGTPETYSAIKRQNGFYKVWDTINKYAKYNDNLVVKYIIFSMNSNENDIREFMRRCIDANIKKIVIDAEHFSSHGDSSKFGPISEQEIKMAILLKHLAIENSIEYSLTHQWTKDKKEQIEHV